jgi:Cytochrome c, mono- and diheme variants
VSQSHTDSHAVETTKATLDDPLTDHMYDGIQEYDNPTPGWWHLIFLGSIGFSILYVLVYHFSPMIPTLHERHAAREAHLLEVQFGELRKLPDGEPKIRTVMGEPKWLEQGSAIFKANCALCHGQQGEGLVGPNMTDDSYKNIKDLAGMVDVVTNGAANGAMPAQKTILNKDEISLVVGYVASLRGKNLPGPRPAEGEIIPPFPPPLTMDQAASGG